MSEKQTSLALLLTGAGFIFLTLWSGQNFPELATWLAEGPGTEPASAAARSIVRLLLSVGLSSFTLLLGVAAMFFGLRMSPPVLLAPVLPAVNAVQTPPGSSPVERALAWLGISRRGLVFLGLAFLFATTAGLAAGDQDQMRQPVVAVTAWVLGMAFALVGGGVVGGWPSGQKRSKRRMSRFIRGSIWPLALAAFSFALRAWALEEIPLVLTGDEGSVGLSAVRFLDGSADNPFNVGWFSFPNLFFWLQSRSIALLGRTIPALRLPSALAGSLTVAGTYLLGRAVLGHRPALFAAGLLAIMPYHVHFSRLGLNNTWDGLFFVASLGLLWWAWSRGSRPGWLLGGLLVGLSQYFYVTSRALPALVAIWLLTAGLLDPERNRGAVPGVLLGAGAAFAAALPLAFFYLRHPGDFAAPFLRAAPAASAAPTAGILERLWLGLAAFTHIPLQPPFYTAGTPLQRALPATFFLVGAAALILSFRPGSSSEMVAPERRRAGAPEQRRAGAPEQRRAGAPEQRRAGATLLVLWLLVIGLAGALSESTPAAQRYVAAAPAAALTAGLGLEILLLRILDAGLRWRSLVLVCTACLLGLLAINEGRFYFLEYGPVSALGGSDTLVADRLARSLRAESPTPMLYFFGGDRMAHDSIRSLPFLVPDLQAQTMTGPWIPEAEPPDRRSQVFVFLPGEEAHLAGMRAQLPGGSLSREVDFEGTLLYTQYWVESPPAPR